MNREEIEQQIKSLNPISYRVCNTPDNTIHAIARFKEYTIFLEEWQDEEPFETVLDIYGNEPKKQIGAISGSMSEMLEEAKKYAY